MKTKNSLGRFFKDEITDVWYFFLVKKAQRLFPQFERTSQEFLFCLALRQLSVDDIVRFFYF